MKITKSRLLKLLEDAISETTQYLLKEDKIATFQDFRAAYPVDLEMIRESIDNRVINVCTKNLVAVFKKFNPEWKGFVN